MVGTSGYAIALGILNVSPEINYSTYPDEWTEQYVSKRYGWLDPVVQFTAYSTGCKRWSELGGKFPLFRNIVMERARAHGLSYGLVIVRRDRHDTRKKHMLSVARPDRELTIEETDKLVTVFDNVIDILPCWHLLTERQMAMLNLFAKGLTRRAVGVALRVSEETVKKDVAAVRRLWGAKNVTEAVSMAIARKIIDPFEYTKW